MEGGIERLRVLFYQEGERWISHCLEYDLLSDGLSPAEAFKNLVGVIAAQSEYLEQEGRLEDLYHPAPLEYWKLHN